MNPKPCAAPHCVARARETHAMSYYGDDAKTDATETRRRKLQQWDTTLDAYAFDKRNDLRATDGRVTNRCARLDARHFGRVFRCRARTDAVARARIHSGQG